MISIGWGLTSQNPDQSPEFLQLIFSKIIDSKTCKTNWRRAMNKAHICAGYVFKGKGMCMVTLFSF